MPTNPSPADALIVADIHLGSSRCKGKHLCRFLNSLSQNRLPRELILAGDTIDHWNLKQWPPVHFKALAILRTLAKNTSVIWIRGNHEGHVAHAEAILGISLKPSHLCCSGGRQFLVCHGDKISNCFPAITRKQTTPVQDWLLKNCKFKTNKSLRETTRVVTHAIALARKEKYDGVITGHTHARICGQIQDTVYANPGSWIQHPTSFLRLESGQLLLECYT
jgi:UDP-2,3-diacylglucosamine pyrophosphatase LpxH